MVIDDPGGGRGQQHEGYGYPVADRALATDPTALTTDALRREISGLRELLERKIDGVETVNSQKYRAIEVQLQFLEQQRIEQKADTKAAVDAALTAQKEAARELAVASEKAITKSEATFSNALGALTVAFQTEVRGLSVVLDDLKTRVTGVEQQKVGAIENRTGSYSTISILIAIVLAVITVVGFIAARGG